MPVTTPAKYAEQSGDPDHFTHVLDHLFIPALEKLSYQVLLPSVAGSELIQAEIIKNLEQADLVLCDLSSLNPNVFFELGIRTALNRPIVLVRDKLTPQVPFDLTAINVFTYDGSLKLWVVKEEVSRLAAHIGASVKGTHGAGNAMWRYFGITKPASPAEIASNPLEAKVDFLVSEFTKMQQREAHERNLEPELSVEDLVPNVIDQIYSYADTQGLRVDTLYKAPATIEVWSQDTIPQIVQGYFRLVGRNAGINVIIKKGSLASGLAVPKPTAGEEIEGRTNE